MKEHGMTINGNSNGTTSFQDKNGKWWHSALVILPGQEKNIKIGLSDETNPADFTPGKPVTMKIVPRYYNGNITGFTEVKNN